MNGLILVDKPAGITSFGVVARVRKIVNQKKVGHAGTLDPMATGVLPVLLGSATRFLDYLPSSDKSYDAVVKLGVCTDTLDTTGEVVSTNEVNCTEEQVREVLQQFLGVQQQVPPMYSAVSKDGVRLYDLARKGETVEREARQIEVYSLKLKDFNPEENQFTISVACSKGTYIRQLASDIGDKLGCGACVAELRRTSAAGYKLASCYTLEELQDYAEENHLEKRLLSVNEVLSYYPSLKVSPAQAKRFHNGGELDLTRLKGKPQDGLYRVLTPEGEFLGLGLADNSKGQLLVEKVYVE